MLLELSIKNQKSQIKNSSIHICAIEDLPIGLGRAFQIETKTIALFRTRAGKIFAVDNRCPHKGGPLAEGMLAGDAVVCPLHAFKFEMTTGNCDQEGVCPIETYPTEIRENQVYIQL